MSALPIPPLSDLEIRRKRALFRAQHRGTKEMDWMLGRYAQAKLPAMDAAALEHFERLLDIADPELDAWIFKAGSLVGRDFEATIADVRHFHSL
jgi:antitoxin CptB